MDTVLVSDAACRNMSAMDIFAHSLRGHQQVFRRLGNTHGVPSAPIYMSAVRYPLA